jgi:ABC-type transporter Mla maintaining outer membrane lipid asymmetry ATPase subunit MlaF
MSEGDIVTTGTGARANPGGLPIVEAADVSVAFEAQFVLESLSLAVEPGEILAVIGPSGVGKTTLLRVLALAVEPAAGTVAVGGVDAWAAAGHDLAAGEEGMVVEPRDAVAKPYFQGEREMRTYLEWEENLAEEGA